MKKFYILCFMLLLTVLLVSCNPENSNYELSLFNEKEIVLGEKVLTKSIKGINGENIEVYDNCNFYELYEKINQFKFYQYNKLVSYDAKVSYENDEKTFINMNVYFDEYSTLCEFETKLENSSDIAYISEYDYNRIIDEKIIDNSCVPELICETKQYTKYVYKNEKAFSGNEYDGEVRTMFTSTEFPKIPNPGTSLCDMQVRSVNFRNLLFSKKVLFEKYPVMTVNDVTYEFNDYVSSKIEVYENYIVLEQDNPFFGLQNSSNSNNLVYYKRAISNNYSLKVRAYFNVATSEIDYVTIVGKTFSYTLNKEVELDVKICVFDINVEQYNERVNSLIEFVKENSTN